MAKNRPPRGEAADADEGDGREGETTSRLFTKDAKKLSDLAQLRGEKISVCFRAVFGKLLDAKLIEAAERRAEELRKDQD